MSLKPRWIISVQDGSVIISTLEHQLFSLFKLPPALDDHRCATSTGKREKPQSLQVDSKLELTSV